MQLHVLPERTSDAAGNMAIDLLLLQRYPGAEAVRFRHYAWRREACTFGYGQKIAFVRDQLAGASGLDLTRRPTGGGLVDHRHDWTYTLVLPRGHPLWERPGPTIYGLVHGALANVLARLGAPVALQRDAPAEPAGVCFARPEAGDVVRYDDGRKVAGAALKRNKHGVLLQGSIWRPAATEIKAWEELGEAFASVLGDALGCACASPGWPEFAPEEEEALVEQFASPDWIERR